MTKNVILNDIDGNELRIKLYRHNVKCFYNDRNSELHINIYTTTNEKITSFNQLCEKLNDSGYNVVNIYDGDLDALYIGVLRKENESLYFQGVEIYLSENSNRYDITFTSFESIIDNVIPL